MILFHPDDEEISSRQHVESSPGASPDSPNSSSDGLMVGTVSYTTRPPSHFSAEEGTVMLGIVIGEQIARGRKIGTRAMEVIEWLAKKKDNAKRIELGVFEYNR